MEFVEQLHDENLTDEGQGPVESHKQAHVSPAPPPHPITAVFIRASI